MILENMRDRFWFAAAKNQDLLGLNLWKGLRHHDVPNTFFFVTPKNNDTLISKLWKKITHLPENTPLDMSHELIRAVEKGSVERVDYIFNKHINAFVSQKTSGEEECTDGSGTEMIFTPYSIVNMLKNVAEIKKQPQLLPVLDKKSAKVSAYIARM